MVDDRSLLVKQVKEANDIVEVVGSYVALRPAAGTFMGLCPFHNDSRPSFDVDPRRQRYKCWSCGKGPGDVFQFIQEFERVTFPEALELLARRAGINLQPKGASPENRGRALLLDVVRWAEQVFHACLLDSSLAEDARKYLGERRLTGETVRKYALGFAPLAGDWLVRQALEQGQDFDLMEKVGLIARRDNGKGWYDRFRDRVMFPIRDARGATVGFGGRIMPNSPYKDRVGKYYNSAESSVFNKSEHLYGLDQARHAAMQAGYLAVVEGYTDVLMAHQMGVPQVVATLGTALNAKHVQQLRRFAPRVVLVFDADAGGNTGVDRALNIFASQDVDLAVATLPPGLDPCDLLVEQGPEAFRNALAGAMDALDFKLTRMLEANAPTVEGRRRALDAVLGIIALAPEMPGQAGALRRELMVSRIAQRLGVKEETVWARLKEVRQSQRRRDQGGPDLERGDGETEKHGPAKPEERELLECLLAEPALVPVAAEQIRPELVLHPTVRFLVEALYRLHADGEPPDIDHLRLQINDTRLAEYLLRLQDVGRMHLDRPAWLRLIVTEFQKRQVKSETQELQNQLHAAGNHEQALELLRLLQNRMLGMQNFD